MTEYHIHLEGWLTIEANSEDEAREKVSSKDPALELEITDIDEA